MANIKVWPIPVLQDPLRLIKLNYAFEFLIPHLAEKKIIGNPPSFFSKAKILGITHFTTKRFFLRPEANKSKRGLRQYLQPEPASLIHITNPQTL